MNGMDCESCVFYVYDDEAEGYFCEAEFDMDEMERLLSHPRYSARIIKTTTITASCASKTDSVPPHQIFWQDAVSFAKNAANPWVIG